MEASLSIFGEPDLNRFLADFTLILHSQHPIRIFFYYQKTVKKTQAWDTGHAAKFHLFIYLQKIIMN